MKQEGMGLAGKKKVEEEEEGHLEGWEDGRLFYVVMSYSFLSFKTMNILMLDISNAAIAPSGSQRVAAVRIFITYLAQNSTTMQWVSLR